MQFKLVNLYTYNMSCPPSISKKTDLSKSTKYISPNCLNIGSIGITGLNGIDGKNGLPGINGENGLPGMYKNGPTGPNGPIGVIIDGQTGPTGPNGLDGINGIVGPTGPRGIYGDFNPIININEGTIINATISININGNSDFYKIGTISLDANEKVYVLAQYKFNITTSISGLVLFLIINDTDTFSIGNFYDASNAFIYKSFTSIHCQCSSQYENNSSPKNLNLFVGFLYYDNVEINFNFSNDDCKFQYVNI
jgi:hypothetical protein